MSLNILYQNELFESYIQGQKNKLTEILEVEKAYFYDFLLRMTGDQNRSLEALDQVCGQMLKSEEAWEQLNKLRLNLYTKARVLLLEVWHADVSKLEHPNLTRVLKDPESDRKALRRAKAYSQLNKAISACKGSRREVILLHLRLKFTFSEIAQILGQSRVFVEEQYAEAMKIIITQVPNLPPDPRKVIGNLDSFPLPVGQHTDLTDLSGLIGGIERDRQIEVSQNSFFGFLVMVVMGLCILFVALLLHPNLSKAAAFWLKMQIKAIKAFF